MPCLLYTSILDYQAVVDCGIPVNPNRARVQTEGGIGQGIGMALYEKVTYNAGGKIAENDLMQYKIPTRDGYKRQGSKKRAVIVKKDLEESGFSQEIISGLHAPIGLAIGGQLSLIHI